MDDKARKFYDQVEKYGGGQQVPANRIYAIFGEILEPAKMGFAPVKFGLLARPINGEITHVPLKGACYDICFGASLSYVPYPYVPKVRWHRTPKSANLDLLEAPQLNWWSMTNPGARDVNPFLAHSTLGEKCFREELSRAWGKSRNEALSWFRNDPIFARDFAAVRNTLAPKTGRNPSSSWRATGQGFHVRQAGPAGRSTLGAAQVLSGI